MMKYKMRRQDREIGEEEALELLGKGEYGILATVDAEGNPYGVPLSYAFEEGKIFFHGTIDGGRKTDNILANDRVCFTVVGETCVLPEKFSTAYHSVIAEGTIRLLADDAEKKTGLMALVRKYSSAFAEKGSKYIDGSLKETAVYELTVESVSGKARRK